MINELQKNHVREVVEKILAQIDWPPEKLCELAVRAALAVSKSPYREYLVGWLNGDKKFSQAIYGKSFAMMTDEYYCAMATQNAISAYNAYRAGNNRWTALIEKSMINSKLAAIARGEKLEISEIVKEMNKIKEEA